MAGIDKSDVVYNSQLDAFELYHLITEDSRRPSSRDGGPALPALGHALAGSVATATTKLLIYPLDLVIARLQVQQQLRKPGSSGNHDDTGYKNIFDAASKIYQHEGGMSAFYTGCAADVSKGIADSFLFFLSYTFLQQYELRKATARNQKQLSVAREMGVGIVAGALSKLVTTPLQNIITRQQTAALLKAKNTKADGPLKKGDAMTISDIARQIYKERGLSGFWAGYSMSLILTLNPAITFAVDNFLQKVTPFSDAGAHVTFLIAAVSKAVATSITYPVSVAKARAQAMPHSEISAAEGTDKEKAAPTIASRLLRLLWAQYAVFKALQKIYQQNGLSGLYSGLEAEVLKGFISHGLTMMIKDRVHGGIIDLYYFILKVTQQWPADLRHAQAVTASVVGDARRRVQDLGTDVVEAGKHAIEDAGARIEHAGTTVVEAGKNAVGNVSQRAENIGVTISEGGKQLYGNVSQRAENVGVTVSEGGKQLYGDVAQRAESVGVTVAEGSKQVFGDAAQRTENVGVTVAELGKSVIGGTVERAGNFSATLTKGGENAAGDVAQRAENIGVTVAEVGKNAVDGIKKAT